MTDLNECGLVAEHIQPGHGKACIDLGGKVRLKNASGGGIGLGWGIGWHLAIVLLIIAIVLDLDGIVGALEDLVVAAVVVLAMGHLLHSWLAKLVESSSAHPQWPQLAQITWAESAGRVPPRLRNRRCLSAGVSLFVTMALLAADTVSSMTCWRAAVIFSFISL